MDGVKVARDGGKAVDVRFRNGFGKRGFGAAAYAKLLKPEIESILKCLAEDLPNDLINDQVRMSYKLVAPWSDFKVTYLSSIQTDLQDFLDSNHIMLLE